jgi:DNA-binding response OmpR family regulator
MQKDFPNRKYPGMKENIMAQTKILVVEDSPTYLRKIAGFIQNLGYNVVTAIDGEEALEKAVTEKPNLMVLDVILPKKKRLSGVSSVENLPRHPGH